MAELFDTENCDENDEEDAEGLDSSANFKKVKLHEAIAARKIMIKWEEQSGDGDGDELLFLDRGLRTLLKRQQNSRKQTTLTSFFSTDQGKFLLFLIYMLFIKLKIFLVKHNQLIN
ncbi:hypothetical protein K3495_g2891 [Podosphaera aphanis]|nr:hypothetical protein K3495_g2891 [Podosphaera aphanis]